MCGGSVSFAVDFGSVEAVFDGFDVEVAKDMPSEVANVLYGDVKLAFLVGFSDFLG